MAERKTQEELHQTLLIAESHVQLGAVYKHQKSGAYYVPQSVALREEDLEPVVVYATLVVKDRVRFTRPLSEWREGFKQLGQK